MATLYDADGNAIEVPDEALEGQGPEGLRKHARKLEKDAKAEREAREAAEARLAQYERKEAFEAAAAAAGVEVTLDEIGDLPPDQITPALLKAKAAEKEQAKAAVLAEQAKALGLTPEEFAAAVKAVAEKEAEDRKALAAAAAVAAGGGSGTPPVTEKTAGQEGVEKWSEAKKAGKPQDVAAATFVNAVAQKALAPSAPAGA